MALREPEWKEEHPWKSSLIARGYAIEKGLMWGLPTTRFFNFQFGASETSIDEYDHCELVAEISKLTLIMLL